MPKEKRPLSSDSGSGSGSGSSSGSGSDSDCSRSPSPPPAKKPKGKTYDNKTFGNSSKPKHESKSKPEKSKPAAKKSSSSHSSVTADTDNEGNPLWTIGPLKKVSVRKFKGSVYIDVRTYYAKDGKEMPGSKGISLKPDQWHNLKSLSDEIDDAILRA